MLRPIMEIDKIDRSLLDKREREKARQKKWKHRAAKKDPELFLWRRAKTAAKLKDVPFNLEVSDIDIPRLCPILGIPIKLFASYRDHSISIDRLNSRRGFVRGNVILISRKAQRLRSNAALDELRMLYKFWAKHED